MDHLQVNSCVNDIAQVLKELPRSWSPVADVGDVRLDSLEDVGDAEEVVILMM